MPKANDPIVADSVEFENVEFIWNHRIPLKMITVLAGQPDQGKGLFGAYLAAEVSKQDYPVLYSAVEDGHSTMTAPRLKAAGANMKKVILWNFRLPTMFEELEDMIVRHRIKLLVIDPLASHLDGVKRASDSIRSVSDPLKIMMERYNCACLIIEHANKRVPTGANPLSAIGGTNSGLVAAARAAYLYGTDPDDEDSRILACVKMNAAASPKALRFETALMQLPSLRRPTPFLVKGDEIEFFDAVKLVSRKKENVPIGRPAEARAHAQEWLVGFLTDRGGSARAIEINEAARAVNLTSRTVRRAAIDMNIDRQGAGSQALWTLPAPESEEPTPVTDREVPTT